MMEQWWCADCRRPVELNIFGRCERCDSDAVDSMQRFGLQGSSPAPIEVSEKLPQFAGSV